MSQENVEIVRAMWEPFKGLDATAIDWYDSLKEALEAAGVSE
jgi:hypothetical protein